MEPKTERRITVDIDTLLALVGAIAGFQLTVWLAISTENRYYPLFTALSVAACVTYLALKKRSVFASISQSTTEHTETRPIHLLLSISFFVLMSCALLSVALRSDQYSRPIWYFVCTALASTILAVEIALLPSEKSYAYFVLGKMILLIIGFIYSTMVLFPGVMGFDPFSHKPFTEAIVVSGQIPTGEYYSTFPIMHLTIGAVMLVSDLDYKMACMLSASLVYVVLVLSFIFLLGRSIFGSKAGLLAALLVGCLPPFLRWGWGMAPNGYAIAFMLASIFLITKSEVRYHVRFLALSMLLMAVLILTHTVASLCTAIVLLVALVGYAFYRRLYEESFKSSITLSLLVLFSVGMLAWWMQGTEKAYETLRDLFRIRLSDTMSIKPLAESRHYMQSISWTEYVLRVIIDPIFWALSFVGSLAVFSRRFGNRHGFVLALSGLVVLAIGIFSIPLSLGILPDRWQLASVFLLAVPAGIGLLGVSGAISGIARKALFLAVFVGVLVFISIISPLADTDNSIATKNTTVRYGFKESELQAAANLTGSWGAYVASDRYYLSVLPTGTELVPRRDLANAFTKKNFTDRQDRLVIIRQEIVDRPFYLPEVFKLDYDPRVLLEQQGFSRVYDCGTVGAYTHLTG